MDALEASAQEELVPHAPDGCDLQRGKKKKAWTGLILDPQGPFAEQGAPRKALTREATAEQEVKQRLPQTISLWEDMLASNVMVFPSTKRQGLALFPTKAFEPGEVVIECSGKWENAKSVHTGVLCQFESQSGTVQTALGLRQNASRDLLCHIHLSGAAEGLSVLTAEWRFSTRQDPVIIFRSCGRIEPFSTELALEWTIKGRATKGQKAEPEAGSQLRRFTVKLTRMCKCAVDASTGPDTSSLRRRLDKWWNQGGAGPLSSMVKFEQSLRSKIVTHYSTS